MQVSFLQLDVSRLIPYKISIDKTYIVWYTYINEMEVILMFTNYLTCPNCGSTAQPKLTDTERTLDDKIIERYTCGCGCHFTAVYPIKEVYVNYIEEE